MSKESIILERRYIPDGTLIMRQGDPGSCAYLIQSGKVRVYMDHEGKEINLAILDIGQIFGEMALVFDEPRTASVVAIEDCNLIIITRESLKQKLGRSDPTVKGIVEMLTKRIVTANNTVMNKRADIEDLTETTNIIYQNILSGLPQNQRRVFEEAVLPKLDEFLKAIETFRERFEKL